MSTLPHIFRRARRSLWDNAYLNAVSTGVIGAALLLVGVYLTVQYNLNTIVQTWGSDVHVSAYFQPEVSQERRFALRDQLAHDPKVSAVRYTSEEDARAWLVGEVEGLEGVLEELGPGVLPASLEITLAAGIAEPAEGHDWAEALVGPHFADIDSGQECIERFNAFLSLLRMLGGLLGFLILMAALFIVTNTVYLVVYNRREELEVQKLVGATTTYITGPFLIEGFVHGLLGSLIAIGSLWTVHKLLVLRLQEVLELEVAGELHFLPGSWLLTLGAAGLALGVGASLVAVQRFLAKAP